jgi:hypothetical protein
MVILEIDPPYLVTLRLTLVHLVAHHEHLLTMIPSTYPTKVAYVGTKSGRV